jgi:hypothetical protein
MKAKTSAMGPAKEPFSWATIPAKYPVERIQSIGISRALYAYEVAFKGPPRLRRGDNKAVERKATRVRGSGRELSLTGQKGDNGFCRNRRVAREER